MPLIYLYLRTCSSATCEGLGIEFGVDFGWERLDRERGREYFCVLRRWKLKLRFWCESERDVCMEEGGLDAKNIDLAKWQKLDL